MLNFFNSLKSTLAPRYLKSGFIANTGSRHHLGKITPSYSCEISAVDHCNNTCLDCNQAAPSLAPSWADPFKVYDDLSNLARVYRSQCVKVVGGEPLLHPDLADFVQAVRRSRIGKQVLLLTNGNLLPGVSDNILKLFDLIEVSIYPNAKLNRENLSRLREMCEAGKIGMTMKYYENFRATFALRGTSDDQLIVRIFNTCKIAHEWDCHAIQREYFYKCPQAIALTKLSCQSPINWGEDGVRIRRGSAFYSELALYLGSASPLQACRYCLGVVGISRPHQMVSALDWLFLHNRSTEDLVDYEKLYQAERGIEFDENLGQPFS